MLCISTCAFADESFRAMLEQDWQRQAELRFKPIDLQQKSAAGVTPEEDAIGAVDGQITGEWGFHTLSEPQPWWQVDFGMKTDIAKLTLYNRCDKSMGDRNQQMIAWVSDDAKTWKQVWQNPGQSFFGFTDKKPLVVELKDVSGRYLRLGLPGTQYFHLDEVQVFANDTDCSARNIAHGRPCTQSSVSPWSARHTVLAESLVDRSKHSEPLLETVRRGLLLADDLASQGIDVTAQRKHLSQVIERSDSDPESLYFEASLAVRELALMNPLLDFDTVLYAKNAPSIFPHMSDQFYCWWQRGGGAICLLENIKSDQPTERNLTADWENGTFLRPDLSCDAQRVLFAYARYYPELSQKQNKTAKHEIPEDAFFHIFEMTLKTGDVRQLTHGHYDDFDARYLPDGQITFLSTRKGVFLQTGTNVRQTLGATLPDSFVRCGGGNFRPVSVFTLHKVDADGGQLRQISAFENFEWTPSVTNDGRITYSRWDYIDRFNGPFISLWSTNPDGTNAQLLYGNYTVKPQAVMEPRAIPGSNKLIFTASAHHSNLGGSLVLFDRTKGTEFERPLERITPEVPFPETERNVDHYYANPMPLSEDYYLVAWSDRPLPPHSRVEDERRNPSNSMGIYLYDRFGNLVLLHRDPAISCMNPIPVRERPVPVVRPSVVDWDGPQEGEFMLQDVYQGLPDIERGTIKRLRIVGATPKVQPTMNSPMLGVSREEPGKYVLGTVPVESDGSARFRVPSGVPYFFQALDANGLTVQTMRSMTYVQPGEMASCVGCHESRDSVPIPTLNSSPRSLPLAARREASLLQPGPGGSWPLRYDRLIQPVLDDRCVSCHSPTSDDANAQLIDMTPAKSYNTLLSFGDGDLRKHAFERDRSIPGETTARMSLLYQMLAAENPHADVKLSEAEFERLTTWLDTYAHHVGSFSDEQEVELNEFRESYRHLLSDE